MWNTAALPPPPPHPEPQSSTQRQIVMPECATEPYNPHLLGQAVDEGGNDGGMEGWRGRKRGGMMEWLLNIQHAAESMQRVVGSLHYAPPIRAPSLHLFLSYFSNSLQTVSGKSTSAFFIFSFLSNVVLIFKPICELQSFVSRQCSARIN